MRAQRLSRLTEKKELMPYFAAAMRVVNERIRAANDDNKTRVDIPMSWFSGQNLYKRMNQAEIRSLNPDYLFDIDEELLYTYVRDTLATMTTIYHVTLDTVTIAYRSCEIPRNNHLDLGSMYLRIKWN